MNQMDVLPNPFLFLCKPSYSLAGRTGRRDTYDAVELMVDAQLGKIP